MRYASFSLLKLVLPQYTVFQSWRIVVLTQIQTVQEIKALGRQAIGHPADVSKRPEVEALVEAAVQNLGPLNVMVANAGICQVKSVLEMTEEDVSHIFEVNVYGLVNSYTAAAKQMIKQGNGGKLIGCAR